MCLSVVLRPMCLPSGLTHGRSDCPAPCADVGSAARPRYGASWTSTRSTFFVIYYFPLFTLYLSFYHAPFQHLLIISFHSGFATARMATACAWSWIRPCLGSDFVGSHQPPDPMAVHSFATLGATVPSGARAAGDFPAKSRSCVARGPTMRARSFVLRAYFRCSASSVGLLHSFTP